MLQSRSSSEAICKLTETNVRITNDTPQNDSHIS